MDPEFLSDEYVTQVFDILENMGYGVQHIPHEDRMKHCRWFETQERLRCHYARYKQQHARNLLVRGMR